MTMVERKEATTAVAVQTNESNSGDITTLASQLNIIANTLAAAVGDAREDERTFLTNYLLARIASIAMENLTGNVDEFEEHLSEISIAPEVLGQLLMQHLPETEVNMNVGDKQYWIAVAAHLGPAWIESLRRTTAFMAKAGQF